MSVGGLAFVTRTVSWPSWLFLLCAAWPVYRLYELALFVFGWIFVHTRPIYSILRSLLTFLLNLIEIAILTWKSPSRDFPRLTAGEQSA